MPRQVRLRFVERYFRKTLSTVFELVGDVGKDAHAIEFRCEIATKAIITV